MRIQFTTDGGLAYFPGLSEPVTIDTDRLPGEDGSEIEKLVQDAHFFEQQPRSHTASGAADYRQYTITIDDAGRTHTVQVPEPIEDLSLRTLVDRLRATARAQPRTTTS